MQYLEGLKLYLTNPNFQLNQRFLVCPEAFLYTSQVVLVSYLYDKHGNTDKLFYPFVTSGYIMLTFVCIKMVSLHSQDEIRKSSKKYSSTMLTFTSLLYVYVNSEKKSSFTLRKITLNLKPEIKVPRLYICGYLHMLFAKVKYIFNLKIMNCSVQLIFIICSPH